MPAWSGCGFLFSKIGAFKIYFDGCNVQINNYFLTKRLNFDRLWDMVPSKKRPPHQCQVSPGLVSTNQHRCLFWLNHPLTFKVLNAIFDQESFVLHLAEPTPKVSSSKSCHFLFDILYLMFVPLGSSLTLSELSKTFSFQSTCCFNRNWKTCFILSVCLLSLKFYT